MTITLGTRVLREGVPVPACEATRSDTRRWEMHPWTAKSLRIGRSSSLQPSLALRRQGLLPGRNTMFSFGNPRGNLTILGCWWLLMSTKPQSLSLPSPPKHSNLPRRNIRNMHGLPDCEMFLYFSSFFFWLVDILFFSLNIWRFWINYKTNAFIFCWKLFERWESCALWRHGCSLRRPLTHCRAAGALTTPPSPTVSPLDYLAAKWLPPGS